MKNTLRFSLLIIGIGLIGYGLYTLLFPEVSFGNQMARGSGQSYAMMAFGLLCLLSGVAYKRR